MKLKFLSIITLISILLSACSNNVEEYYQKVSPLNVSIETDKLLSSGQEEKIIVSLTQNGKKVIDANFIHIEIIKQDGNINYGMTTATNEGNGIYSKTFTFDSDGLYFIKIHAGNNHSIIMPQTRLIVGTLSDSDKQFLKQDLPVQTTNHEGHH